MTQKITLTELRNLVKKNLKESSEHSVDELYGPDFSYKHKEESLNMKAVLEGLDLLREYRPAIYDKYFPKIFKKQ